MTIRYNPDKIERKWQIMWQDAEAFTANEEAERKYYLLEMFPYPSGRIHMGHVRNYSIGDVLARFLRMKGYNVLHPMGWDAFGLPAENAAIDNNIHPAIWTDNNIRRMKDDLIRMGISYDWTREIKTCDPNYYKWNQWFFIKMYEMGLAYRMESVVNWCPGCLTVLANEQVVDGHCWRCDSEIAEKKLKQWFLKITDYADELLEYCDRLRGWPERVITMQKNWIGKSIGANVRFPIAASDRYIEVFTTRPDTLFGVTFVSLAPEHPIVDYLVRRGGLKEGVNDYINMARRDRRMDVRGATSEKEGVETGSFCINPMTGGTIPIYISNFVLMEYGTGAVMGVPTHDQRDFEFAKRYRIPMKVVIKPYDRDLHPEKMDRAYEGDGIMMNSDIFNGMDNRDAMASIVNYLEEKDMGRRAASYRLRDWGISRQRYWGCPIPIIHCERCGIVPAKESDLPVMLPQDVLFTGRGGSPLEQAEVFLETRCPRCNRAARRETDTMDTFVDSSWYFLRYVSANVADAPFDNKAIDYWMPVDQYIGGVEHAVMHLLYARFFTKVLRDMGLVRIDEPFMNLLTQGMVCKETIRCPKHGHIYADEVEQNRCKRCGEEVDIGAVEKMSKSKKNIVDPCRIVEDYGADTTRLFTLFAAPPERDLEWNIEGVEGLYRFLCRVWRLVHENLDNLKGVESYDGCPELDERLREIHRLTHATIKKVTEDIEDRFHFNTAISAIMELLNVLAQWEKSAMEPLSSKVFREAVEALLLLLSPFAPHICEELWSIIGNKRPIFKCSWPAYKVDALKKENITIIVQINGRLRAKIDVPADISKEKLQEVVTDNDKVKSWLQGREIKKIVHVPKRLINLVVD